LRENNCIHSQFRTNFHNSYTRKPLNTKNGQKLNIILAKKCTKINRRWDICVHINVFCHTDLQIAKEVTFRYGQHKQKNDGKQNLKSDNIVNLYEISCISLNFNINIHW
jgi:hypothetical protein